MEKLYLSLTWLEMPQALDRLQCLTKIQITERHLLQLCDDLSVTAYFDVSGLSGSDMSNLEVATAI